LPQKAVCQVNIVSCMEPSDRKVPVFRRLPPRSDVNERLSVAGTPRRFFGDKVQNRSEEYFNGEEMPGGMLWGTR